MLKGLYIGSGIGLTAAVAMFYTIPAYHDFIMWQFSHPVVWLLGLPVGIALGYLND
tara:strand:+ start:874 stop:1041 length:168 start_codon:yes stop_codon:yes gene_type:complete